MKKQNNQKILIINCVIATLFTISLILNIFMFSGYRFVKTGTDTKDPVTTVQDTACNHRDCDDDSETKNPLKDPADKHHTSEIKKVVYEDKNIKVTYCGVKEEAAELTYLFEIENNYDKAITVFFDELHVNGTRVYVSGLTCSKLAPGTSTVEDFVLVDEEWDQDHNEDLEIVFNIKLVSAKSYMDIYSTEQIIVELD